MESAAAWPSDEMTTTLETKVIPSPANGVNGLGLGHLLGSRGVDWIGGCLTSCNNFACMLGARENFHEVLCKIFFSKMQARSMSGVFSKL
jgi:hypothetical protein